VDRNGIGVRNVDLNLFDDCTGELLANAHDNSDSLGNFAVVAPPGTYSLHLDPPACKLVEALRIPDLVVSGPLAVGTGTLQQAFLLTGVVHNADGSPMADAKLRCFDVGGVTIFQQGTTRDHTSATGAFSIALPSGTFDVNVEPPVGSNALVLHLNNLRINGNTSVGTVTASNGLALTGHLAGPGGPAANVSLAVLDHVTRAKERLAHDGTDAQGDFRVVVPPGTYDVQYDPPVCDLLAPTSQDSVVVTAAKALPPLALVVGAHLQGTVTDTLGAAVADVDLDAFPPGGGEKLYTPHDVTSATGAFDLLLPPGTYDMHFNLPSTARLAPASIPAVNALTTRTMPVIRLKGGWFLSVTVRQAGTLLPIEGVQLQAARAHHSRFEYMIRDHSDAAGLIHTVLEDSVYDLVYFPPAGSPLAQASRLGVPLHLDTTLPDQLLFLTSAGVPPPPLREGLALALPAPNPSRGRVQLSFRVPNGQAELSVWDVAGRRVATPWRGHADAPMGLEWNATRDGGERLPPGCYLVRLLDSTGALQLQRITLLP